MKINSEKRSIPFVPDGEFLRLLRVYQRTSVLKSLSTGFCTCSHRRLDFFCGSNSRKQCIMWMKRRGTNLNWLISTRIRIDFQQVLEGEAYTHPEVHTEQSPGLVCHHLHFVIFFSYLLEHKTCTFLLVGRSNLPTINICRV